MIATRAIIYGSSVKAIITLDIQSNGRTSLVIVPRLNGGWLYGGWSLRFSPGGSMHGRDIEATSEVERGILVSRRYEERHFSAQCVQLGGCNIYKYSPGTSARTVSPSRFGDQCGCYCGSRCGSSNFATSLLALRPRRVSPHRTLCIPYLAYFWGNTLLIGLVSHAEAMAAANH